MPGKDGRQILMIREPECNNKLARNDSRTSVRPFEQASHFPGREHDGQAFGMPGSFCGDAAQVLAEHFPV
jgi:hypothetical protein